MFCSGISKRYSISAVLAAMVCIPTLLSAQVVINEFNPGANPTGEWVELYNAGASGVDISGWYLDDGDCSSGASSRIAATTTIAAAGFFVVAGNDQGDNFNLSPTGDVAVLCDGSNTEIDRVEYGNMGSAPAAMSGYSVARVTNGADTGDYAADFNVDSSPTQGAGNDVPGVDLGSSVILNEIDSVPLAGNQMFELYNPTGSAIDIGSFYVSNSNSYEQLGPNSVSAHGVLALETAIDFTAGNNAYLFDSVGDRIDQLGWEPETEDYCIARMSDGQGPNDGYDWTSSGGDVTLFDRACTLGELNEPVNIDAGLGDAGSDSGAGDTDTDTDTDIDTDTDTDTDTYTDTSTDTDADTDTDTDTDTDADSDTDADTDSDTDADADTDTDVDSDTDADTDTNTDTDTTTDLDSGISGENGDDSGCDCNEAAGRQSNGSWLISLLTKALG